MGLKCEVIFDGDSYGIFKSDSELKGSVRLTLPENRYICGKFKIRQICSR